MTDNEIIDQIQEIRTSNNKLWMDILRLAAITSPGQTKFIFSQIINNDKKITKLSEEFVNGKERESES